MTFTQVQAKQLPLNRSRWWRHRQAGAYSDEFSQQSLQVHAAHALFVYAIFFAHARCAKPVLIPAGVRIYHWSLPDTVPVLYDVLQGFGNLGINIAGPIMDLIRKWTNQSPWKASCWLIEPTYGCIRWQPCRTGAARTVKGFRTSEHSREPACVTLTVFLYQIETLRASKECVSWTLPGESAAISTIE